MNVTKLLLRSDSREALTHVGTARSRVTRTSNELVANVASVVAGLHRLGIGPGDRVLILSGSRVEAIEALLAVLNMGATAMPVSALFGTANMLSVVARMTPACCIFEDAPEGPLAEALSELGCVMIAINEPRTPTHFRWHAYADLLGDRSALLEFPEFPDRHPALVLHGSGSSGRPKAVGMSHGALIRYMEYHHFVYTQYSEEPDQLYGTSPILTGLPIAHIAGLGTCLQGLLQRRPMWLLSFFIPEVYLKLVEEIRCTFIVLVPSLYRSLLKEPYLRKMDRSALRFCITGGEACPRELIAEIESAFGVPLVTGYSMTECLSGLGHLRRDLFARTVKPGSCGRQLFGEVKLCDSEGREQRTSGELWVRNPTVHACYLDPALNEERLEDGWFKTGDLFTRDADGDFFYLGRADDMFICNGKNIYPLEIESLLMTHPAVDMACAAPVSTARRGVVPGALIVTRHPVARDEIQEFMMKLGPSHAVPQVLKQVDSLPQLGPGKIDRRRATELLQNELDAADA